LASTSEGLNNPIFSPEQALSAALLGNSTLSTANKLGVSRRSDSLTRAQEKTARNLNTDTELQHCKNSADGWARNVLCEDGRLLQNRPARMARSGKQVA
jgi:hypothetical protein